MGEGFTESNKGGHLAAFYVSLIGIRAVNMKPGRFSAQVTEDVDVDIQSWVPLISSY